MTLYTYPHADDQIGEVAAEIHDIESAIGHKIPPPWSQTIIEDLHVMLGFAKAQGQGVELMTLARRLYAKDPREVTA